MDVRTRQKKVQTDSEADLQRWYSKMELSTARDKSVTSLVNVMDRTLPTDHPKWSDGHEQ
jgi:hypothetical protein